MVQKFLQGFLQGHWYKNLHGERKQQGVAYECIVYLGCC